MPPRIHVDIPLATDSRISLSGSAAKHVHVLRLQPGDLVRLFRGDGHDWAARITAIGPRSVDAVVIEPRVVRNELPCDVTISLVVPANDRMDSLVEKATELGAARIAPLISTRSVVRLDGERAIKRCAHWQAVAIAAAEQCGRAIVPEVMPVRALRTWLSSGAAGRDEEPVLRLLLAPRASTSLAREWRRIEEAGGGSVASAIVLSGPEGGFDPQEEEQAIAAGYVPCSLGPRVLRADTAPLAALATIAAMSEG